MVKWRIPNKFVFAGALPKTSAGKIDYLKLMGQYEAMELP